MGNFTVNLVPLVGSLCTSIFPPCKETISLQENRPKPIPFLLVVLKGLNKLWSMNSLVIPWPVSVIWTTADNGLFVFLVTMVSCPPLGIASRALRIRFLNTLSMFFLSIIIFGSSSYSSINTTSGSFLRYNVSATRWRRAFSDSDRSSSR